MSVTMAVVIAWLVMAIITAFLFPLGLLSRGEMESVWAEAKEDPVMRAILRYYVVVVMVRFVVLFIVWPVVLLGVTLKVLTDRMNRPKEGQ